MYVRDFRRARRASCVCFGRGPSNCQGRRGEGGLEPSRNFFPWWPHCTARPKLARRDSSTFRDDCRSCTTMTQNPKLFSSTAEIVDSKPDVLGDTQEEDGDACTRWVEPENDPPNNFGSEELRPKRERAARGLPPPRRSNKPPSWWGDIHFGGLCMDFLKKAQKPKCGRLLGPLRRVARTLKGRERTQALCWQHLQVRFAAL